MIKTILKVSEASFIAMQDIYLSSSSKTGLSSPDAMVGKQSLIQLAARKEKSRIAAKKDWEQQRWHLQKDCSNFAIHFLNCMQFLMKQLLHTIELQTLIFRERSHANWQIIFFSMLWIYNFLKLETKHWFISSIIPRQSFKRPRGPLGPIIPKLRHKKPQGYEAVGQGIHRTPG